MLSFEMAFEMLGEMGSINDNNYIAMKFCCTSIAYALVYSLSAA